MATTASAPGPALRPHGLRCPHATRKAIIAREVVCRLQRERNVARDAVFSGRALDGANPPRFERLIIHFARDCLHRGLEPVTNRVKPAARAAAPSHPPRESCEQPGSRASLEEPRTSARGAKTLERSSEFEAHDSAKITHRSRRSPRGRGTELRPSPAGVPSARACYRGAPRAGAALRCVETRGAPTRAPQGPGTRP